MCLAVAAEIIKLDKQNSDKAQVRIGSITKEVCTALIDKVNIGDYVLIHAGFAIQKIDQESAEENWQLWQEINSL